MEIIIRRRSDLASQAWEVSIVPNGIDVPRSTVLLDQWDRIAPYIAEQLRKV